MTLLAKLLAEANIDPTLARRNSVLSRVSGSNEVWKSACLTRIQALPRRRWQDAMDTELLCDLLTAKFKTLNGTMRLKPIQAVALRELHDHGRLNVVAGLGSGKTLVTALLPVLLGAKRPLFLNYSRLMNKTLRDFRMLAEHWQVARNYEFLSVERLSSAKNSNYLEKLCPDLIVVDESHSLKDVKGSRFKRLRRYREAHPDVPVVPLTATPGTDSLNNFAHIQDLVHGERSPLPRKYHDLQQWCQATDVKVELRRGPGALTVFSDGDTVLEAVRAGIGRRIEETPGNIYHRTPESTDCSLYLDSIKFDGFAPASDAYFEAAWHAEKLPDDRCFEEMYSRQLILRQLGCGFCKVLNPTPPEAWREARKNFGTLVRDYISQEKKYALDTPLQVVAAIRRKELNDFGLYAAWKEVEPTFKPVHVTEWYDLGVIQFCADWLREHKGLVWCTFPSFGRKLSEVSGLPFFHAGGLDYRTKADIESYYEPTGAILALEPNKLGRNLQDRWHKNLFVAPPASALDLDQAIGRTARFGQKKETVEVSFLFSCRENFDSVTVARSRADYDRALGRNENSKLLVCDWNVADLAEVSEWEGARWER